MLWIVRIDRFGRCALLFLTVGIISTAGFVCNAPGRQLPGFVRLRSDDVAPRYSSTRTSLPSKLWERLQIEEDDEPFWYLLNCIAGLELDLMRQCRAACEDMPDAIKFVVPTERKTRSHGANRMVTEEKVKYPGYVFAKLRLCPDVYEAVQTLDLCRSWMGTVNRKGYKKLPPSPVALNDDEVENFGLEDLEEEEEEEEESGVIVDAEDDDESLSNDGVDQEALKVYRGLKVEDMVKVTKKGTFFGEDGIIRRLKDGNILVRFYTYGSMFEEWMDPGDLRALSNVEILKGLSGPSQPVTQRDFDGPGDDRGDRWASRRQGSLRGNLMGNVKGNRGIRNRRRDRTERGDRYKRDFFGRSDEERAREERNWKWYQENQRQKQGGGPQSGQVDDEWNFRAGSPRNNDNSALSDVDSQWGRPPSQRQRRKAKRQRTSHESRSVENAIEGKDDWSAFVSQPSAGESNPATEEDAFFASLMSDLSDDLSSDGPVDSAEGRGGSKQNEDDFFSSLASQLSEEVDPGSNSPPKPSSRKTTASDDDFFATLEAELGSALQDGGTSTPVSSPQEDTEDFFAKLEAEMMPSASQEAKSEVSVTANEAGAKSDVTDVMVNSESKKRSAKRAARTDSPATKRGMSTSTIPGDISKLTVPVLKDMLRERGLKVSGKKAELIERLQQQ